MNQDILQTLIRHPDVIATTLIAAAILITSHHTPPIYFLQIMGLL